MNEQTKKEMKDVLTKQTSLDINISPICKRPIDYQRMPNYFGKNRKITHLDLVEDINNFYQSIFGWIKANPSEPGLAEAMKSVFLWCNESQVAIPERTANTKKGHRTFIEKLKDKSTKTLILQGKKGSGKTFYLNYVLNTETRNLEKEGLIWYRVDATKVFDINKTINSRDKHVTLSDYLFLQIAYVTLKYRDQTPIWKKIFDENNPDVLAELILICKKQPTLKIGTAPNFTKTLSDFKEMIELIKAEDKDKITKNSIKKILQDPKRKAQCELVSRTIIQYLIKNNYRPVFIIDGMDNVDSFRHQELYVNFVNQIAAFSLEDDHPVHEYDALHIISMRNETYNHLRQVIQSSWVDRSDPFTVEVIRLDEVISLKNEAATNTIDNYFKSIKQSINIANRIEHLKNEDKEFPFKHQSDFDMQLNAFIKEYRNDIVAIYNRLTGASNIHIQSLDDILHYIYNDNLRCFLINLINVYRYYTLFVLKRNILHRDVHKPYLLTEGILLNGYLWMNSYPINETLTDCIPNIFWFDRFNADNKWQGLCLYRLLQMLKDETMSNDGITSFLNEKFQYSKNIIEESLNRAVSYGLVMSDFDLASKRELFYLTDKGRLFLDYTFLDINQFYYMALDTPLSTYIEHTSSAVKFHNYVGTYWENFSEAAIFTSITLKYLTEIPDRKVEGWSSP